MIETETKSRWSTDSYEELAFRQNSSPGSDGLPETYLANLFHPGHELAREEKTVDEPGSSRLWKNFEHYKCFRDSPTSTVLNEAHAEFVVLGYPKHRIAISRNARAGVISVSDTNPYGTYGPFGEPGLPIAGLPGFYLKRSDGGFVPPPEDLETLLRRSLQITMPGIKAELSLVNSLIELKELRDLPMQLKRIYQQMSSLGRSLKTLRQYLRGTSNSWLQVSFNWNPLVSDIHGVYTALSRTERRINDLITRAGKPQRRHWTHVFQEFADSPYVLNPDAGHLYLPQEVVSGARERYTVGRSVESDASIFHVEIEYNYNFTRYQVEHAQLLGILDSLGVNLNPSIIWNALPWSFVVDWVLGVGRWLDQFTLSNLEPQINIRRCLWSIKRRRIARCTRLGKVTHSTASGFVTTWQNEVPLPVTIETAYRRQKWMPTSSSIESSGLTTKEVSLGAALVLSRKRNRTRR